MTFRIATWNVLNRVSGAERIRQFLDETEADVYAFQELTTGHCEVLDAIAGWELRTAEDFVEGDQLTFLGLLTRAGAAEDGHVASHNRTRAMSPSRLGRRYRWIECLESLSVAFRGFDTPLRIINLHLTCGISPRGRARELAEIVSVHEGRARSETLLVVGDFNAFARPWLNWAIGWTCGFDLRDLGINELRALDRAMLRRNLRTCDHGATYPQFRLTLDRVYGRGARIASVQVLPDTYGSDHRPVVAELAL